VGDFPRFSMQVSVGWNCGIGVCEKGKGRGMLDGRRTWCVISGLASLMSRFIFLMMPMCSSLFSSVYFSSLTTPGLPGREVAGGPCALALNFCVATSCGSVGGGSDRVPSEV